MGLRSKLYSLKVDGVGWDAESGEAVEKILQKSATAGTPKSIAKKKLTHSKFLEVLRLQLPGFEVEQRSIRSFNHQLFNVKQTKLALSAIDDKRFICSDGAHTRALGHVDNDPLNALLACFSDEDADD